MTVTDEIAISDFAAPGGYHSIMQTRPSTVDWDICMASITEDEYGLEKHRDLEGWALDIGAHIGAVSIALAIKHPKLNVLSVEIVPENAEMLRQNAERNNVADRVTIVQEAAGGPDEISRECFIHHNSHPVASPEYVHKHRFIANSFWSAAYGGAFDSDAVEIPSVSLSTLMARHAIDEFAFMKIDAEGAEWAFLRDPAVAKVRYMIGEYHWDYAPQGDLAKKVKGAKPYKRKSTPEAELHSLLDATHEVTVAGHPTIGHFEAWLR